MNWCVMYCNRTGRRSSEWFRTWVLKFTGFEFEGEGMVVTAMCVM
jgi:hypothetical protein